VAAIRGASLSESNPLDSAEKSCIPPTASSGKMATESTMMPMPPIQ
jgi:hypothetical protein